MGKIIRIFHGSEVWIEKSVQGSMFGITRLCRVMPNSHPEGQIFKSAPNNHDRFFCSPAFDFNMGSTLTSYIHILLHLPF